MSDDTMNGNAEDDEENLFNSAKLLSGCSLLQVHINSGKGLPKDGAKEFCPSNSWMEKKQIQCALDERRELLDEERVEKWGCLAGAVWDQKKKLAEVTRRAGKHFQTLGFEKEGTLYLYPEEALYLLETNSLELTFGGVSVSIQQGYSLLLGSSTGCNLNEYRTYSHLMRQGYKLLRFTNQIVHTKYERAIRLDQHAPVKRSHPGQLDEVGTKEAENCAVEVRKQMETVLKNEKEEIPKLIDNPTIHKLKEAAILVTNETDKTEEVLPTNAKHFVTQDSALEGGQSALDIGSKELTVPEKSCNSNEKSGEELKSSTSGDNNLASGDLALVQEAEYNPEKESQEACEEADVTAPIDVCPVTKARGITDSLLSLFNDLVEKEPSSCNGEQRDLSSTLQSEIIEVLEPHLETGVSKEALAAAVSSATSTILSQTTSGNDKVAVANDAVAGDAVDNDAVAGDAVANDARAGDDMEISNDNGGPMDSNDEDESGKVKGSQDLKRTAPSDGEDDCEPVLVKKAKVMEIDEVEILDFVPENKQVELVNLSDDSSMDSAADSEVSEADCECIEVIDVLDTSSSDSTESDSASSGSDSSVIVEENTNENWDLERRRILETFPNMYNMTEISLTAPRPDLLPDNVNPQHDQYRINRWRLLRENKETALDPPPPELPIQNPMRPGPPFNFGPPVWQPNISIPINPAAAVQAIAQLVLPMLGLPLTALPTITFPSEPWVPPPPRPWGPRPHFNQNRPRGNNGQRFRSRPYGYRHHAPRFHHYRRGSNYNHNHRPFTNFVPVTNEPSRNEVVPFQSSSQSHSNSAQEPQQWISWKEKNMPNRRGRAKQPKKKGVERVSRYFNPPRKYTHMKLLKDENPVALSGTSDESSATCEDSKSPIMKTESTTGDEDSKSDNMDTSNLNQTDNGNNENTDESCSSPTEVKPLLSPHDCTTFASVFKSVQVIKEADTQTLVSTSYENRLRPQFDLFSPSKPFKKGNPPLPDFHLCIMRYSDAVPGPGEMKALADALNDSVPIMFAIVSPDSISYFQFCDTSLPSVLDSI